MGQRAGWWVPGAGVGWGESHRGNRERLPMSMRFLMGDENALKLDCGDSYTTP